MKARWLTGLAIAATISIVGAGQTRAQTAQPSAGAATPGANIRALQGFGANAPSPFIPDIRAPQSAGLNPFMGSLNAPNIRNPLSGTFNPFAVNPFFPDIRSPLTGTFNPAPIGPFGNFGVPTSVVPPTGLFFGDPFGSPVVVGSTGWAPYGYGYGATPVAVPVPVPVPATGSGAASAGYAGRRTVMREGRSIQDMERLMARVPLTSGTITVVGRDAVRARIVVGGKAQVRRYPMDQVFFFAGNGELRSAVRATRRPVRGESVLVPVTPIEKVVMNR